MQCGSLDRANNFELLPLAQRLARLRRVAKRSLGVVTLGCSMFRCVDYSARPLDEDSTAILRSPERAALADAAVDLQHPYLQPRHIDFAAPLSDR